MARNLFKIFKLQKIQTTKSLKLWKANHYQQYSVLHTVPSLLQKERECKIRISNYSTQAQGKSVLLQPRISRSSPGLQEVMKDNQRECLVVKLSNGESLDYPFLWLRDNCQCPKCYNGSAFARFILLREFNVDSKPKSYHVSIRQVTEFVKLQKASL